MTNDQAIRAGLLAVVRRDLRAMSRDRAHATVSIKGADGKVRSVILDLIASKAALEAADLNLSNRLEKLGVSELCD